MDFVYAADSGLMREVDRYLGNQLIVKTVNSYDDFGRLTGIVHENSTGVISTHGYDYDALNRLTAESRDGVSRSFAYDKIDEVKSVTGSNTESYTYDKNGNRTNAGYKHIDQNRLNTDGVYSYEYDLEGNRTKRTEIATGKVDEYIWDYRNRLTSVVSRDVYGAVTQTVAYEYDVNNLRVSKNVDGSIEKYFLDGDNIAFVTDGAGKQTFHYLYGMEADQVLAQNSEAGMVWSLADRLGSIDVLTNEQGIIVDQQTYDSFGNTLSQLDPTVKFRFGYTGRESDPETGLYYYRARCFDANVGRFISTDPIGFEAGDANLYRYVGNRSTIYTDPSGEVAFLPILAAWAIGAVIAGAGVAVIGATLGGTKEFALSAAEDYDKHREIDWSKAFNRGVSGAASGAAFGFGFGVVSTIPGGQIVLGLAITAGVYGGAQKATGHFRDGAWAQGIVESVDLGFNFYGGVRTVNKAFGEISQIGKGFGGGSGRSPELAFAGGNYGMAGGALALPVPQTSGLIGGGVAGHNTSYLFKPYFASDTGRNGDNRIQDADGIDNNRFNGDIIIPTGKGENGTASTIGNLSKTTKANADKLFKWLGATYKPGKSYDTYKFEDKSVITIRHSDNRVTKEPKPEYALNGNNINKGKKLSPNGDLLDTRDQFGNQIPNTHDTGERVK